MNRAPAHSRLLLAASLVGLCCTAPPPAAAAPAAKRQVRAVTLRAAVRARRGWRRIACPARAELKRVAEALHIPAARRRIGRLKRGVVAGAILASDRLAPQLPAKLRGLRPDALPLGVEFLAHESKRTGAHKVELITFLPRQAVSPTLIALGASTAVIAVAGTLAAYPMDAVILVGAKYAQLRRDSPGMRITPATVGRALRDDWRDFSSHRREVARRLDRRQRARAAASATQGPPGPAPAEISR